MSSFSHLLTSKKEKGRYRSRVCVAQSHYTCSLRFCNTDYCLAKVLKSNLLPCTCGKLAKLTSEVKLALEKAKNAKKEDCRSILNPIVFDPPKINFSNDYGGPCSCILPIIVSYDSNCQYPINLHERFIEEFPDLAAIVPYIRFAVPYVHLKDHTNFCEYTLGTYYMPGGAHFYGEQAESVWPALNPLGNRTRQMGTNSRHDTIDEHISDWNRVKVSLMSKFNYF